MASYEKFQNNRLFILGGKLWNVMVLSLLWLLCSLPVITIGASSSALYFSTVRCLREQKEDTLCRCFFRSFKSNLLQGIVAELIYIVYGGLVGLDIYVARNGINGFELPEFYEPVAYALLLPIAFTLPFVFPSIARFSNKLRNIFKNSFVLCASHPLHTVAILLLVAVSGLVCVLFPPIATVVPCLCAWLCSMMTESDFKKALGEDEEDEENEDETDIKDEEYEETAESRPGIYGSEEDLLAPDEEGETA